MGWKLVTRLYTPHLLAAAASGTAWEDGRNLNQLLSTDLSRRTRFTGAQNVELDRGSATGTSTRGNVNCALLIAHNLFTRSVSVGIDIDNNAIPTTVFASAAVPTADKWYFVTGTENGLRFGRFEFSGACEVGCAALGFYYDIGKPKLQRTLEAVRGVRGRRITWRCTGLTYAQTEAISADLATDYVHPTKGPHLIDGYGGKGGQQSLAIYDDTNTIMYWGGITCRVREENPGYYAIDLTLTEEEFGISGD